MPSGFRHEHLEGGFSGAFMLCNGRMLFPMLPVTYLAGMKPTWQSVHWINHLVTDARSN